MTFYSCRYTLLKIESLSDNKPKENEKIQPENLQGGYRCDCAVNLYKLGCFRGKWYRKWKPCILGRGQQYLDNCPVPNFHFVLAFFIQSK